MNTIRTAGSSSRAVSAVVELTSDYDVTRVRKELNALMARGNFDLFRASTHVGRIVDVCQWPAEVPNVVVKSGDGRVQKARAFPEWTTFVGIALTQAGWNAHAAGNLDLKDLRVEGKNDVPTSPFTKALIERATGPGRATKAEVQAPEYGGVGAPATALPGQTPGSANPAVQGPAAQSTEASASRFPG